MRHHEAKLSSLWDSLTPLVTLLMVMLHLLSAPLMTILGSPAHTELTLLSWMAQCLNFCSPISVIIIKILVIIITRPAFNKVKPKDWYFVFD